MSVASPLEGRWQFVGAYLHQGSAVGPTHEFETAEEFIELNDDDERGRLEWSVPAVRAVARPGPSWLELRDDGRFVEHEEPGEGPRRWYAGGTAGEPDERGPWQRTDGEFAARLAPESVRGIMAPVYFDQVLVEPSGELHRRIVSVVDGLYVDLVRAYYRRPGATGPSSVERYVAERVDAIRALVDALTSPPDAEGKAAAVARLVAEGRPVQSALQAACMSARQKAAWACASEMIAAMRSIQRELRAIPNRSAPFKRSAREAIDVYFDQLREVGVDPEA